MKMSERKDKRTLPLAAYDEFCKLIQDFQLTWSQKLALDWLTSHRKNIDRAGGKLRLAVLGEAKSGKSTFINAWLGCDLLPMDVKQCTSAILTIRYGPSCKLTATCAGGQSRIVDGLESVKKFLVENAALHDAHRDIPVYQLNKILIQRQGKLFSSGELRVLLSREEITSGNLYHLPDDDYTSRITDYIQENQSRWREFVTKITIEYPYDDPDLRCIEIIDTPGVNAEGHLDEITRGDLDFSTVDAIVFVRPLVGTALEMTSALNFYRDILEKVHVKQSSPRLFLILSRAANDTEANINRIYSEAIRQFPEIPHQHIIPVDSKVELFRKNITGIGQNELDTHLKSIRKAGMLDPFLFIPWVESNSDKENYIHRLRVLSNFNTFDRTMSEFISNTSNTATDEFFDKMHELLLDLRTSIGAPPMSQKMVVTAGVWQRICEQIEKVDQRFRQELDAIDLNNGDVSRNVASLISLADSTLTNYTRAVKTFETDTAKSEYATAGLKFWGTNTSERWGLSATRCISYARAEINITLREIKPRIDWLWEEGCADLLLAESIETEINALKVNLMRAMPNFEVQESRSGSHLSTLSHLPEMNEETARKLQSIDHLLLLIDTIRGV